MKLHSKVKSLLRTSILTYITIIWHILLPVTHTLLVSTTSCYKAQNNGQLARFRPKWGNDKKWNDRPNFERCIRVDRPIFKKYVKNVDKSIQIITRLQPGQLYRAFIYITKTLLCLTELTAGRLSLHSLITETFILLQAFNNRLHHSRRT